MAKDYPLGKGRICKAIQAAIRAYIDENQKRPKKCLINRKASLLPRTVDGITVKPSRQVRPQKIRLI